jgi:hypothetical protein
VGTVTVQVVTLTLVCSCPYSVPAVWNLLPAVLGVDAGWDARLRAVKILASAKRGLRVGRIQGNVHTSLMAYWRL